MSTALNNYSSHLKKGPQSNSKKKQGKRNMQKKQFDIQEYDKESCCIGVVKGVVRAKILSVLDIKTNITVNCHCRGHVNFRSVGVGAIVIFAYLGNQNVSKTGELIINVPQHRIYDTAMHFSISESKISNVCGISISNSISHFNNSLLPNTQHILSTNNNSISDSDSNSDSELDNNESIDNAPFINNNESIDNTYIIATNDSIDNNDSSDNTETIQPITQPSFIPPPILINKENRTDKQKGIVKQKGREVKNNSITASFNIDDI